MDTAVVSSFVLLLRLLLLLQPLLHRVFADDGIFLLLLCIVVLVLPRVATSFLRSTEAARVWTPYPSLFGRACGIPQHDRQTDRQTPLAGKMCPADG
jgi:hypothetical protein